MPSPIQPSDNGSVVLHFIFSIISSSDLIVLRIFWSTEPVRQFENTVRTFEMIYLKLCIQGQNKSDFFFYFYKRWDKLWFRVCSSKELHSFYIEIFDNPGNKISALLLKGIMQIKKKTKKKTRLLF